VLVISQLCVVGNKQLWRDASSLRASIESMKMKQCDQLCVCFMYYRPYFSNVLEDSQVFSPYEGSIHQKRVWIGNRFVGFYKL
jgi:hypothetical protein